MSDALVISYVPGYTFVEGEIASIDKLNLLARPTINLAGTIGTSLVTDNSITTVKLVDGVLSADAAGRAKMEDGYFNEDARGKFAADFFGAGDAPSLAMFEDGFWTANAAGRAKFANGFFDGALIAPSAAGVIGVTKNLLAFNNGGTPNSKVDITADEVVLKASGAPFLATSVSVTADITVSGANGLDTGSEGPSVWYYLWLIYNPTTATVAALLSTSATAPTLPSGYTYKGLIGEVRNNGSSNFMTFYRQDQSVYLNHTNLFTGKTAGGDNTYESYSAGAGGSDVALATLVPPTARRLRGTLGNSSSSGNQSMAVAADANGLGAVLNVGAVVGSGNAIDGFSAGNGFEIPLKTAQTFYWKTTSPAAHNRVSVSGYST